jgi:hypothetical protein
MKSLAIAAVAGSVAFAMLGMSVRAADGGPNEWWVITFDVDLNVEHNLRCELASEDWPKTSYRHTTDPSPAAAAQRWNGQISDLGNRVIVVGHGSFWRSKSACDADIAIDNSVADTKFRNAQQFQNTQNLDKYR